jgi:hypothetical protein
MVRAPTTIVLQRTSGRDALCSQAVEAQYRTAWPMLGQVTMSSALLPWHPVAEHIQAACCKLTGTSAASAGSPFCLRFMPATRIGCKIAPYQLAMRLAAHAAANAIS